MILKSLFAVALTVSAFVSIAQDTGVKTEIPEDCLTVPTVLSIDGPKVFQLDIDFECQIFNYKLTVYNSEGEVVYESKDAEGNWNAEDAVAGTYTWEISGSMGNTLDYYPVEKNGSVSVVK